MCKWGERTSMTTTATQNPHAIEGRASLLKKVLFAAALTLIIAICTPMTAWADEAKAIEVGSSITASQDNSFFKFKAPHDGRYAFVSNAIDGKANTLLRLYREKLKANRIDYSYGDGTQNSRILRHLKKGEVVYLECASQKKKPHGATPSKSPTTTTI